MDGSLLLSGSLFVASEVALCGVLCGCCARGSRSELRGPGDSEAVTLDIADTGAMAGSVDTAPLTNAPSGVVEGARHPRCVHPTSVRDGRDRIVPVAATGLHWPRIHDHTAERPNCEPEAAWQWLQRSWGLFIICWSGCLAILVTFGQIRTAAEADQPGRLVTSLDVVLWSSSCSAGLTCFGWGVLATVAILLVLVGIKGARYPWPVPLLLVFSPLEDVNLGIVFGGSRFALEAAIIFFVVLIGIVAWATYNLSIARKTQKHLGCSWGSAAAVGSAISVVCAAAAVAMDIAADTKPNYGVHGAYGLVASAGSAVSI